jgi:two-component system nitrate/nitrite response regulator NarL
MLNGSGVVHILSGDTLLREVLGRLLTGDLFGRPSTGTDWREIEASAGNPIIIIDLADRDAGLDACRRLRDKLDEPHIVLLSKGFDPEELVAAFTAGADAYLPSSISAEQLEAALRLVQLGGQIPDKRIVSALAGDMAVHGAGPSGAGELAVLSAREIETVRCLAEGMPNKLIARGLGISEATVKAHVKSVLRKLNLHNRTEIAAWAVRAHVI